MSTDPHNPSSQPTGNRSVDVDGDNDGVIVTGDGNTVNVTRWYTTRSDAEEQADLRRRAEALLAQLPTDDLPPHRPLPAPSRPVYARNPNFVGRERELRRLAAKLKAGAHVAVAATGLGGMGKSQLAIEFVHRYGHYFAGGVYWVSMAQAGSVHAELAACGVRLGLDGTGQMPQPQLVAAVRRAWETPLPRLLIFDNCEEEALYQRYRPQTTACRVLLTSRNEAWPPGSVDTVALRALPRDDSIVLLRRVCDRLGEDEADRIAQELGDFPLALHVAGGYLHRYRRVTVADLLTELGRDTVRHPALQPHRGVGVNPSGHDWDVARTFDLSLSRLQAEILEEETKSGNEKTSGIRAWAKNLTRKLTGAFRTPPMTPQRAAIELLARAACFAPGAPLPVALLWATVDADETAARRVEDGMWRLLELGLLTQPEGAETVQLHRLLARFVQEALADERPAALAAVESTLYAEANKLNKAGYPLALRPWVAHLQFVTDTAVARQADKAADLCNELGYHLDDVADYEGAKLYYEEALQIDREVLGDRHPSTATSVNNMGYLLLAMGDNEGARPYYEEALQIWRKVLGDRHPSTATSVNNMGYLLLAMGDNEGARPYFEEALQIRRAVLGDRHPDTAGSLNNMGGLLESMGAYEQARPYYEEALQIAREVLGDRHPDTAGSLNNMGALLQAMGECWIKFGWVGLFAARPSFLYR